MKWKLFLSGIIAGGVTAGIGTLLTAPYSGRTTRRRLQQNTDTVLTQLSELKNNLQELQTSATEAVREMTTQVPAFITGVKTSVSDWERNISSHQEELQREMNEIKDTLQRFER